VSERNQASRSNRDQIALRGYLDASAEHNKEIQNAQAQGWRLNADGHQAVHRAARIQHQTLERYTHILEALADLGFSRDTGKLGPGEATETVVVGPLTPRENEVLKLIASGLTSRQIAGRLKISFKTVVVHRYQLMRKLDVHDVVSLVRYAIRNKLTEV
jgi:DNA-binding NarL/FixJ family response regulator